MLPGGGLTNGSPGAGPAEARILLQSVVNSLNITYEVTVFTMVVSGCYTVYSLRQIKNLNF